MPSRSDLWTPDDLAYAAGFLDGEGCFYVDPRRRKICVTCTNTDRPVINWFQATFGGSVSKMEGKKANHRRVYSWQVVARDAWHVCGAVAPYLRVKTEQALLCLTIQGMGVGQGHRPKPEVRAEQERLAILVKEAKKVEW